MFVELFAAAERGALVGDSPERRLDLDVAALGRGGRDRMQDLNSQSVRAGGFPDLTEPRSGSTKQILWLNNQILLW